MSNGVELVGVGKLAFEQMLREVGAVNRSGDHDGGSSDEDGKRGNDMSAHVSLNALRRHPAFAVAAPATRNYQRNAHPPD